MRPEGDVRRAIFDAAREFKQSGHLPTMRELAARAQVGLSAARTTVHNMSRAGVLTIAGERDVDYRNKPVAVYEPKGESTPAFVDLAEVFSTWSR